MTTVRLSNLSIGYRTKNSVRTVAAGLGADIRGGELTCLLGPNGVGKSTLLRTLAAFQPPLSGDVVLDDGRRQRRLGRLTDRDRSRLIGVVLTERPDVRNMTSREMVAMGRAPYTGFWGTLNADDRRVVDEAIALVGIGHLQQRLVETLSDGERQKVMIAKALAQQTPVVYLDEPTAFLDFPSKVEVMLLLRRIAHRQQKTVFLSTHDLELALQTADRLWLMDRDRGLSVGTPQQLAASGVLGRFVERPDISFDRQTLTVKVRSEHDDDTNPDD